MVESEMSSLISFIFIMQDFMQRYFVRQLSQLNRPAWSRRGQRPRLLPPLPRECRPSGRARNSPLTGRKEENSLQYLFCYFNRFVRI